MLSPLRFHYDAPTFTLPVRLGLLNSAGKQDLIVHLLGKKQRYEVANYKNASIPTNIVVEESVRKTFGSFYDALFERTIGQLATNRCDGRMKAPPGREIFRRPGQHR